MEEKTAKIHTTATAVMVHGTLDTLSTTLGTTYAVLLKEGSSSLSIYSMNQLDDTLRDAMERGIITSENAGELKATAQQIGIPADEDAVRSLIKAYEPPPGMELPFNFRLCAKHGSEDLLPHGHIYRGTEDHPANPTPFFGTDLLREELMGWTNNGQLTVENAAVILRDATRAGVRSEPQIEGLLGMLADIFTDKRRS